MALTTFPLIAVILPVTVRTFSHVVPGALIRSSSRRYSASPSAGPSRTMPPTSLCWLTAREMLSTIAASSLTLQPHPHLSSLPHGASPIRRVQGVSACDKKKDEHNLELSGWARLTFRAA
jgi:hypothetical protein